MKAPENKSGDMEGKVNWICYIAYFVILVKQYNLKST